MTTYMVRFQNDSNNFSGYQTVSAKSLKHAKTLLLAKCGAELFAKIDWTKTKMGKAAEDAAEAWEKQNASLFW